MNDLRIRSRAKFLAHSIFYGTCVVLGLMPAVRSSAAEPSEYQIKAVFLLNFTKFVGWPPASFESVTAPFTICIVGEDPFGTEIDQIVEGEMVDGHRVAIERVRKPVPRSCKVLFISKSEKDVPALLASLGPGVLTVSERDSFITDGGMIDFIFEDRRIRFDINQGAVNKASLMMSARLLNVARNVKK
jgi:hypothetical protein